MPGKPPILRSLAHWKHAVKISRMDLAGPEGVHADNRICMARFLSTMLVTTRGPWRQYPFTVWNIFFFNLAIFLQLGVWDIGCLLPLVLCSVKKSVNRELRTLSTSHYNTLDSIGSPAKVYIKLKVSTVEPLYVDHCWDWAKVVNLEGGQLWMGWPLWNLSGFRYFWLIQMFRGVSHKHLQQQQVTTSKNAIFFTPTFGMNFRTALPSSAGAILDRKSVV